MEKLSLRLNFEIQQLIPIFQYPFRLDGSFFLKLLSFPPPHSRVLSQDELVGLSPNGLSRVDRFLPILQGDVCFLCLPPGFLAVPHYFNQVSIGPGLLQGLTVG